MIFVRLSINHDRGGRVIGVMAHDTPFDDSLNQRITYAGENCEMVDFGVVEDQEWTDLKGVKSSPATHIVERLAAGRDAEVRKRHDCPCTISGIKNRLRQRGPAGIPVMVKAWLANILPPDEVAAMGIGRGLPVSALKAAEAIRNRRDPRSGSRMHVLERQTQKLSNARAAIALERRKRAEGKEG